MKYLEADFIPEPYSEENADILKALAADGGFESFADTDNGFKAYILSDDYHKEELERALNSLPLSFHFSYSIKDAEDKDWNEAWEKEGFAPVYIGAKREIVIHDTLHPDVEKATYDILINPQLAFGTGTHETTGMLLEMLLKENLQGKSVIDMGCGTGILGIFCCMRGAKHVTAIDIDEWSVKNTAGNARLNHVENFLKAREGNAETLPETGEHDILTANINRNILLRDLPRYAAALKAHGATIFLSGFYTEDIPVLTEKARLYSFEKTGDNHRNSWACLKLSRK